MLAVVIEKDQLYERILEGSRVEAKVLNRPIVFVCVNEQWYAKLPYDLIYLKKERIQADHHLILQTREEEESCQIYFYSYQGPIYDKYAADEMVKIGPDIDDSIYFPQKIELDLNKRTIHTDADLCSLNGNLVHDHGLRSGDVIVAMNLKMIIGPDFLMIRKYEGTISLPLYSKIAQSRPLPLQKWSAEQLEQPAERIDGMQCRKPKRVDKVFEQNTMTMLLPSVMMLASTLILGIFNAYQSMQKGQETAGVIPYVMMPGMMLISTLISYPMAARFQKRKQRRKTAERNKEYQLYLDHAELEILLSRQKYYGSMYRYYPSCTLLLHDLQNHLLPEQRESICAGWFRKAVPFSIEENAEPEEDDQIQHMNETLRLHLQHDAFVPLLIESGQRVSIAGEEKEQLFLSLLIQGCLFGRNLILLTDERFIQKYPFLVALFHFNGPGRRRIVRTCDDHEDIASDLRFITVPCQDMESYISISTPGINDDITIHTGRECILHDRRNHSTFSLKENSYHGIFPKITLPTEVIAEFRNPSFLDLYQTDDVRNLSIKSIWESHENEQSLCAVLGFDQNGRKITLDLSEKKMGPHGLIAGTTGSGKSELILTMMLSLMINYSPDQIQIAFIDFKGGSTALALQANGNLLPHIVGTLSNLDQNNYDRVLYALKNECIRRQKMLHEAEKICCVSIMNLYDYRIMMRKSAGLPPLADLVIVVDEFAELKTQNYEMLDQLISIARIGRSLGIHLILSTQKPAGIVNDQIWSNSHFKICMRVSEKQDSMEILHSDDAMDLKNPGEFILECDGKKERGCCGYSGYRRSKQKIVLQTIAIDGNVDKEFSSYGEYEEPQISSVCRKIDASWKKEPLKQLWLEPIKKCSCLDLLEHRAVYIYDDYYHQRQPYGAFLYDASSHWGILTSDQKVKDKTIQYLKFLFQSLFDEINVYLINETGGLNEKTGKEISNLNDCQTLWKNKYQKKIIIVTDLVKLHSQGNQLSFRDLMMHSQIYNLQFVFLLNQSSELTYYEQNMLANKICLKNNNTEDMSIFLGTRVKKEIKDMDAGYVLKEHLLDVRMGYLED